MEQILPAPDQSVKNLIDILEKTNQQLSLWYNPYAVMVAVLSFLIAFLAISFAFILWRQSKEQKDLFKEALLNYESSLNEKLKQLGEEAEKKIQDLIDAHQKEIQDLPEELRQKTQKVIDDLIKEKKLVANRVQLSALTNSTDSSLLRWENNKDWNILSHNNSDESTRLSYCDKCHSFHTKGGSTLFGGCNNQFKL